ncbi:ras-related protein Rab-18-like [Halichondria panicea]|uniref:ras-related protein Rab-18-like n=1 Tax=Halichondria panicea TaxID=6063 RepID=UPI00312BA876
MEEASSTVPSLLKILLIGDMDSDKRRLLQTYMGGQEFTDNDTLGLDYKLKDVMYGTKRIELELWDTAGQERFRSVTASYYRDAHGALLVFSLAKETTFVSLNYWLGEIEDNAPVKFQVILVATGYDDDSPQVRLDIAEQFAQEKNLKLVKCNVTDPASVESTFSAIIETIMSSWEGSQSVSESIRIRVSSTPTKREHKCC